MKIIIFIIIACTLFVAWSLCIVGASADEQLEMIHAKDLERKENGMNNTYAPTENKEQEKIKVESIDTIVTMHGDKPYYENKYREVGDKCYHIGYSSYYLDVALEYRKKYFEVVERESDWIPYQTTQELQKSAKVDEFTRLRETPATKYGREIIQQIMELLWGMGGVGKKLYAC